MQEEEGELQRGGDSSSLWLILQVNLPLLWMILQVNQWRCSGSISWMWQSGLHRTQARCARISYLLTVSLFSPYQLKGKKCLLHIHLKKPSMRTLSLSLSLGSESGYKSQFWLHILKICIVSYLKFASYHILKFACVKGLLLPMATGALSTNTNSRSAYTGGSSQTAPWGSSTPTAQMPSSGTPSSSLGGASSRYVVYPLLSHCMLKHIF